MYSPIIYQALCEHVQTQMSLMNNLASKNNPNGIPTVPCQTMSDSESQATAHSSYGLSTSTPVQLLQHPSCPPVVHSEVQTDGDNQFASQSKTVSVNCADVLQNSFSTGLGVPCSLPKADKPTVPPFQQLGLINGILPQQGVPKEPDLLKCIQTYVNLLHSHPDSQICRSPTLLPPAFLSSNEDKCAKEQIGEVTSEGKDLNIHMRDSRIKDVQKAKNVNQSAEKARTIKYLLGELKALLAEQEDSEIQRLITELEACISLLPAVSGNTNIQVEIALAMQPLRSENAQLRRQLRILNRQLREQEKSQKASGALECNLELFSLQSLNKSLQNQLQESLKSQELLQSKNEELLKVIENQKDENKKFAGIFKEKDQTLLENKQQFDIETTRIKIELEEALVNVKSSRFKLEAAEKENQILGITLRQRDAEVTRLRELTRSTSKKTSPLSKRLSPQPQITVALPQLVGNSGLVSEKANKSCEPGVCSSSKKEAEDAPEKLPRPADREDKQLLKKIKEAISKIPAASEEPPEPAVGPGPATRQGSGIRGRSSAVSDGSFLNSDMTSDWSISSFSTFTSRDEQDFRNGLAALDANIARLQKSLKMGLLEK
ncbi:coiled-coil domain-containing protein 14 isoform X4 [Neomonachus schauinslandi]|uniref:Coiled-coil domain-containing protein 14 isoform X4 n=1 Tax=Neomonachus schauinslandi TaxID=29088 RepID=A0A8M1MB39_NEOSC|nr:coiled-coil domain-containing protein 14 isoform X4 [Neomonachus schauinslandi]